MAKAAFNQGKKILTSKLELNLRKTLEERYIWSKTLYVAKTWTLRKIDQQQLENSDVWCWRNVVKDQQDRNEELRQTFMEEVNWNGHIFL